MSHRARSITLVAALAPVACAPVFSDLQSARTLPRGAFELSPQGTSTWGADGGDPGHIQNHFGVQAAVGLSGSTEVRARFEHIFVGDEGANVLALGPKVALVPDRLALYVPVAVAFAGDSESKAWAAQPALIASFPLSNLVELNPSAKYTIPINDADGLRGFALNLGLGVGPRDGVMVFRPEAGVMFAPDGVRYYQASAGLTFRPR